jgi:glycosyltransferase involved in cell wall biosynthesis
MKIEIKSIDIVTSARNEQGNIFELFQGIEDSLKDSGLTYRLIIADNRSTDNTWIEINQLFEQNRDKVLGLRMSRDFGYEGAIRAALSEATADAIVMMSSDLQDNPLRIPELISELKSGVDHVYQIVEDRPDESWIRRLQAKVFYSLAENLSDGLIVKNSSTFRAFTKPVLDAIKSMPEKARFLRALAMYVGFSTKGVVFPRSPRKIGLSKAGTSHVIGLGVRGIVANSTKLLNLIGVFGVVLSALSILTTAILAFLWITLGVPFAGFGTIVGLILLAFGSIFLTLGIMAQYLALIYQEVKARPDYIISESTNWSHGVNPKSN